MIEESDERRVVDVDHGLPAARGVVESEVEWLQADMNAAG